MTPWGLIVMLLTPLDCNAPMGCPGGESRLYRSRLVDTGAGRAYAPGRDTSNGGHR